MTPDPQFFTRCQRTDHGSQYHHGEYWRFWDDRSLSLLLQYIADIEGKQGEWDELQCEKDDAEEEIDELQTKLEEAEEEAEKLREELETAKARIAELEGQVKV